MRRDRTAAVLGRHPPAGRRLRRHRVQPVGRARLHQPAQLHRPGRVCRCGPPTGTATHPLVGAGGHCTYNPEPLADFVDFVVLGDGEEVVGEITEVVADVEGRTATRRIARGVLRELAGVEGVYVPVAVRRDLRRPTAASRPPPRSTRRARPWSRSAPSPTWPTGPTRSNQLVPLTEVVHDRLNVEVFRGCTRGCRFCQAGMITRPVRERPAEQVRHHDRSGACAAPATTRSRSPRCPPPTSPASSRSSPTSAMDDSTSAAATSRWPCPACGSTPSPWASPPRSRRPAAPGSRSRPRPALAHAPGHQQAHQRGRPLRRGRLRLRQGWRRMKLYFLTGLPTETDEDTLGIAELARNCVELGKAHHKNAVGHRVARRVRAQAVHAVPVVRPEHRGRAAPQDRPPARRPPARPRACSSSGTTPRPRSSRASSAAAIAASARSSRTSGGGAARSRSGASTSTSTCGSRRSTGRLSTGLVRPPAPHRGRGAAVGPPLGRAAQGLPLAGLARRPRRGRPRGLPLDPLLRLRCLHRLRHRARRRLGGAAGRRQPGHRPGPVGPGQPGAGRHPRPPAGAAS